MLKQKRYQPHFLCLLCISWLLSLPAICTITAQEQAGQTKPKPQFMLDTGGHTAIIEGLAFTSDGKYLVSAGHDKVIRVWDWQAEKTVRVLRIPIERGSWGKIYAMAVSPNGQYVAAGGYTFEQEIYLFDFRTGELKALLRGHTDVILGLNFSPDSKWLLSGGADSTAILWDVERATLLYRLTGHKDRIHGVSFSTTGTSAFTASDDNTIRKWNLYTGELLKILKGHSRRVMAVSVSPNGDTIASTSWDDTIRLWNSQSGESKKVIDIHDSPWNIGFTPDGKFIITSRGEVWNLSTGTLHFSLPESKESRVITIHPDGQLVASVDLENTILVWSLTEKKIQKRLGGQGYIPFSLAFSPDGDSIAWSNSLPPISPLVKPNQVENLTYTLALPTENQSVSSPQKLATLNKLFVGAITQQGGLQLKRSNSHSKDDIGNMYFLDIFQSEQMVGRISWHRTRGFRHQAYTFSLDGEIIATGGANGQLWAYDRQGNELGTYKGHVGYIYSLAASPDNRFLVSTATDQTIKLWNLKTRELIVTLFHGNDGEWVMWVPQGYYTSSRNGDRLVGWHINQGFDKKPRYIRASQFKRHLYSPEIINEAIRLTSAKAAIKKLRRSDILLQELLALTPPKIKLLSPTANDNLSAKEIQLSVELLESSEPIKGFDIFVNNRRVTPPNSKGFLPERAQDSTAIRNFTIPLANGKNTIQVTANSWVGSSEPKIIVVNNQFTEASLETRETLYIVAIGVDQYPEVPPICNGKNGSCQLKYAGKDAQNFHDTLTQTMGQLHKRIKSKVLFNGAGGELEPTKDNIVDALDLLQAATAADTVVVFLSGHGTNYENQGKKGSYLFLPTNAKRRSQGSWISSTIVSWAEIEKALHLARGRRMLFVDTCRAAGAYNERLLKNSADESVIVFSASDSQSNAQEREDLQNGIFTHVVVRGFQGEGNLTKDVDDKIEVLEFTQFVDGEIARISKYQQKPEFDFQQKNFILAKQ